VYGYGAKPATGAQPYDAKDIVILSDALCASTCSLFLEMMHQEGGVQLVVAGGIPYNGPMQAAGYDENLSKIQLNLTNVRQSFSWRKKLRSDSVIRQ
jgi:hypothetical protein